MITQAQLHAFAPKCQSALIAPHLSKATAGMSNRELRHFMVQTHHESMGFTRWEEAMSYSAERLCAVFPSRFPTVASARSCARNPRAFAEKVYGGRMGNTSPGDGYKFRGRSPIQLTGKNNYATMSPLVGKDLVANPDLAAGYELGSKVAVAWWKQNGLPKIVAEDADEVRLTTRLSKERDDIQQARKRINGGMNGIDDCLLLFPKALALWP